MNRPPRLKLLSATTLAVLLLAAVAILAFKQKFEISAEDVTAISATLSNRPDGKPEIQEFEVPNSFHKEVLDSLDGASPHRSQIDWAILGNLKITTNTDLLDVVLFSAGDSIVFDVRNRPGGKYESKSLSDFIRTIEEAQKAQAEQ